MPNPSSSPPISAVRFTSALPDSKAEEWGAYSGYRFLVGTAEIAWMEGRTGGDSNPLVWHGEMSPNEWQRENLPSLVRMMLPEQAKGLTDDELFRRADVRAMVVPAGGISWSGDEQPGPESGLLDDVDVTTAAGAKDYQQAISSHAPGFIRLEVEIDDAWAMMTYTPEHQASVAYSEEDAKAGVWHEVTKPAEIAIRRGTPWSSQTLAFFKDHHSDPVVASLDPVRLATVISDAARRINDVGRNGVA